MANVTINHRAVTGAPANPRVLVDGPAWDDTHVVTGLENVDNTSDANKPVSTAQAAAIALKAPLASPTFTGAPTAPTPAALDNSTAIATTAFVNGFMPIASLTDLQSGTAGKISDTQLLFQLLIADSLIQNNALDAVNDIDVLLNGSAVATKRLDAAWADGTNAGGLDTGTKANSTTYHVWLLRKNSDGTLDALFSTQPISPTVPSGYTKVRVLGAIITDASGTILTFLQSGDYFALLNGVIDYSSSPNPATPPTLRSLTVPQGVKVVARVFFDATNSSSTGGYVHAWDADLGAAATNQHLMLHLTGASENGILCTITTSANRQIYTLDNASSGTSNITLITQGWFDPRVRRHAV